MLRSADIATLPKRRIQTGLRHPNAVYVACRNSCCPCQTDHQAVYIGTFAAEVFGLKHRPYVTEAAARRVRVSPGSVHNPIIDGPEAITRSGPASHDALGGRARTMPSVGALSPGASQNC